MKVLYIDQNLNFKTMCFLKKKIQVKDSEQKNIRKDNRGINYHLRYKLYDF